MGVAASGLAPEEIFEKYLYQPLGGALADCTECSGAPGGGKGPAKGSRNMAEWSLSSVSCFNEAWWQCTVHSSQS